MRHTLLLHVTMCARFLSLSLSLSLSRFLFLFLFLHICNPLPRASYCCARYTHSRCAPSPAIHFCSHRPSDSLSSAVDLEAERIALAEVEVSDAELNEVVNWLAIPQLLLLQGRNSARRMHFNVVRTNSNSWASFELQWFRESSPSIRVSVFKLNSPCAYALHLNNTLTRCPLALSLSLSLLLLLM